MPRELSRIDLEVTRVRVERLRNISEDDVRREGVESYSFMKGYHADKLCSNAAQECFRQKWADIYGHDSWAANHWVWAVDFKTVRP
jgi:hypothetical protein